MKTYLIIYFNKNETFSGYAFVVASNPREADTILTTQGRYIQEGYKIISTKCIGENCECPSMNRILYEGVSPDGLSAYQIALKYGFQGTEQEWVNSLKGDKGDMSFLTIENNEWYIDGEPTGVIAIGQDGYTPIKGVDYFDGEDGKDGVDGNTMITVGTLSELQELTDYTEGTISYIKDIDKHYKYINNKWTEIILEGNTTEYVAQPTPPDNTNLLWINTSNSEHHEYEEELSSVQIALNLIQKQLDKLMPLVDTGIIAGTPLDSVRQNLMQDLEPEDPLNRDEESDETSEKDIPKTSPIEALDTEPTVRNISIKMGKYNDLKSNIKEYIDGEPLWATDIHRMFIYQQGTLYLVGGSEDIPDIPDGPGSDIPTIDMDINEIAQALGITLSELEDSNAITKLNFESVTSGINYKAKVNDEGKFIVYESSLDGTQFTGDDGDWSFTKANGQANVGLVLNSMYAGGDANEHSYLGCSHNFVELCNIFTVKDGEAKSDLDIKRDINLNEYALVYTEIMSSSSSPNGKAVKKCEILPLWGKIKAGETFLIRGAQCSVMDANTTKLKIKSYDMEWKSDDGTPVKFNKDAGSFYLCHYKMNNKDIWGQSDGTTETKKIKDISSITNIDNNGKVVVSPWVCDLFGYRRKDNITSQIGVNVKTSDYLISTEEDVVFRRWYPIDPVSQSNAEVSARTADDNWTVCFLDGRNVRDVQDLQPRASYEHKTIAQGRTSFSTDKPGTITMSVGLNGDAGCTGGATRCFCWNSVGYYDESLQYREKGTDEWTTVSSINSFEDIESQLGITFLTQVPSGEEKFWQNYYFRKRWETPYNQSVTTHKVIIKGLGQGLSAGQSKDYEFRVVRNETFKNEDYSYKSDIKEFTIYNASDGKFKFLQTTDQQGATWEEYEVWTLSAEMIGTKYKDERVDFAINTGDICYNGSRPNEWIDYLKGFEMIKDPNRKKILPEMLCIGNNDLAPVNMYDLGNGAETPWKINVEVADYYYCNEWDVSNPPIFEGLNYDSSNNTYATKKFRVPSLYSFNYGGYHFICLLSEIRTGATKAGGKAGNNTVKEIFGISDLPCESNDDYNPELTYTASARKANAFGENAAAFPYANGTDCMYVYYLIHQWLLKDWEDVEGRKCMVYTHEMPINIISAASYNNYESDITLSSGRETAKAYLNRHYGYLFSRIFKDKGVKIVMGGHKHTVGITYPIYDAPENWDYTGSTVSGDLSYQATFCPVIQVTQAQYDALFPNDKYVKEVYSNNTVTQKHEYRNSDKNARCRVEIISDEASATAPSYIMCQATGFKNRSNSDLAADGIPWEKFYVPARQETDYAGATSTKVVSGQCYPFFTEFNVHDNECDVNMMKIKNMYPANRIEGYWDLSRIYNDNGKEIYNREDLLEQLQIVAGDETNHTTELTIKL